MAKKTTQQTKIKSTHYDVRLIRKIVQAIEEGAPRSEIVSTYQCSTTAISTWMRKFGSENYQVNLKRQHFSRLQKRSIVSAITQNRMSIEEAILQYGIRDKGLIREWIAAEQKELADICISTIPTMAKKKLPDSETDVAALRKALEESQLKIKALNTMIDIAEQELKINIRKKSGAKQ